MRPVGLVLPLMTLALVVGNAVGQTPGRLDAACPGDAHAIAVHDESIYPASIRSRPSDDLTAGEAYVTAGARGQWTPYGDRYAIVVMGGNVSGQMYKWYWNDTSGMVWTLMDWGFDPENIFYLSYGDSAVAHPELADGTSTKENVHAAFDTVAARATCDDLVHVWWVDHGNTSGFEVHGGFVYFTELRQWIDNIDCRVYIGAYNPCYSGAIMPHMENLCTENRRVITATSVNAYQGNSYGWAGMWRAAVRGGRPTSTVPSYADVNQDGYVAIDEAYEWEAPHSNANGEYPLLDDNCDGVGGDFTNPATYDPAGQDSTKDGFYSQFYGLMGWYDRAARSGDEDPFLAQERSRGTRSPGGQTRPSEIDIEINWSAGAPLPSPVCRGASGLIGDKMYLFGGHPTPAPVHYVYDIASDTWSTDAAPLPTHGSLTRGVVHDEQLYVFGGHTIGSDTIRCYHPATNSWEILSSPHPDGWRECCKYGAGVVAGEIHYYYVEEYYSYLPLQASWEYDVASDSWTEETAAPSPKRMYVASASDSNYCYAVGGIAHDGRLSVLADAIRYDPSTRGWETIDPLPEPVAFADGDFLRDHLFVAGGGAGYDRWPASDRVYCWAEGEGWMTATPLPAPVGCPHVELTTIDETDYIFVFGGYDNGYLNDFYVGEILWQTGVDDDQVEPRPSCYALQQNRPNPFNPVTTIQYELPRDCHVKLDVCNIAGQRVTTLVDSPREAGIWSATWDAVGTASGVYFCRLSADGVTVTRKMVLLE